MDAGVNFSGAEYSVGTSGDTQGVNYFLPTDAELDYFAAKGFDHIRLPLLWERLQPTLNAPLDAGFLAKVQDVVARAAARGIDVVLDVHAYGAYHGQLIGSDAVPVSAFADLWGRLAGAFAKTGTVSFDLMNEPQQATAAQWLTAANAAIAAIRATGATQQILVPGAYWDGAWSWTSTDNASVIGAAGAIKDPLHNYAIEVHQYLDDTSGQHDWVVSPTIGVERLQAITAWARAAGVPLYLGEFGVASNPASLAALSNMMDYMKSNADVWQGYAYFTAGTPMASYMYTVEPSMGMLDTAQMDVVERFVNARQVETALAGGGRRIDTIRAGAATASLSDVLAADGSMVSRTLYDAGGHATRTLVVGSDGGFTVTTLGADGTSPLDVAAYSAARVLVSRQQWAANGTSTKSFYAADSSVARQDDFDAAGAPIQSVDHTNGHHVVTKFTAGVVSSTESYTNTWQFEWRAFFDGAHRMTSRQVALSDGTFAVENFDVASGQLSARSLYTSSWSLISTMTYDLSKHGPAHATATGGTLYESDAITNWSTPHSPGATVTGTSANDVFYAYAGDTMIGGAGDDHYSVWNNNYTIREDAGGGIDTLNSYLYGTTTLAANVENLNLLGEGSRIGIGNALGNIIAAGDYGVWMDGGAGGDVLIGGAGRDVFSIKAGNGSDAVEKFQQGRDLVRLDGYGVANFAQLMAGAKQTGADVTFGFANGEVLVLRDTALGSLSARDFRFVNLGGGGVAPVARAAATAGASALTGPGAVATANGWFALNNVWNAGSLAYGRDYQIDSTYNAGNLTGGTRFSWSFPTVETPTGMSGTIRAYPELIYGPSPYAGGTTKIDGTQAFPIKVGDLTGLKADYDVSLGGDRGGYNVAFDLWFTSTPGGDSSKITNEVMIWLHQGAFEAFGDRVASYQDGDFAATIYHDPKSHYTAVVANADSTVGQLDMTKIFAALRDLGILSANEYLADVELGAEVASGTGSFAVNKLQLDVSSVNADGNAVTKTVTGKGMTTDTVMKNIVGSALDDNLVGNDLDNVLIGNAGNDTLDGRGGANVLKGGLGNDTYTVRTAADTVVELAGEGIDTVTASIDYVLGDNVENLALAGAAIRGTGNALDNVITGNELNNILYGDAGDDTLYGGAGNDTLIGGSGADRLYGGVGDDVYVVDDSRALIFEKAGEGRDYVSASVDYALAAGQEIETLAAADARSRNPLRLTGNEFDNVIVGNAGDNVLDGGAGNDVLRGGDGNDVLYGGLGADTLYGDAGDDTLYGGAGNDRLYGGTGNDRLYGGAGDDMYFVDDPRALVFEQAGEGTDTVMASVDYRLTAGQAIEYLMAADPNGLAPLKLTGNEFANAIYGNAGDNILDGGAGNDVLRGGAGNDVLIGGTGIDTMSGGTGNDTYYVDDARDAVVEARGEGFDTVVTSVGYRLAAGQEIEVLRTIDADATTRIDLVGNEFDNVIYGNAAANVLMGGAGDDTLYGGAGNDMLYGGSGADKLYGGTGDDIFIVEDSRALVFETVGEGTDTVKTSVDFKIGAGQEIEYLMASDLNGRAPLKLAGNEFGNLIYGNAGDNVLDGGAGNDVLKGGDGNDVLIGGAGQDTLFGGAGDDTFAFRPGDFAANTMSGCDRIADFAGGDRIDLSAMRGTDGGRLSFVGDGAFSGVAGQVQRFVSGGNTFVSADLDGDRKGDVMVRLDGNATLAASSFVF